MQSVVIAKITILIEKKEETKNETTQHAKEEKMDPPFGQSPVNGSTVMQFNGRSFSSQRNLFRADFKRRFQRLDKKQHN